MFAWLLAALPGNADDRSYTTFATRLTLEDGRGKVAQTFAAGERITLVLAIENLSDSPQTLCGHAGRLTSYRVLRLADDDPLWDSRARGVVTPLPTVGEVPFEPGETKVFAVGWDQRGDDGQPVGCGAFEARAFLALDGTAGSAGELGGDAAATARFTIR